MNNLHTIRHISEFLNFLPKFITLRISLFRPKKQLQSCNVPIRLESNSETPTSYTCSSPPTVPLTYSASRLIYKICSGAARRSLL